MGTVRPALDGGPPALRMSWKPKRVSTRTAFICTPTPPLGQSLLSKISLLLHRRVSRDQEQHAAQLFKVRLRVAKEAFTALTAAPSDENSPAPASTQSIPWPKQEEVAKRLFDRTNAVLGNQSMTEFSGVEFMVLTPAFQTLQQQTINRLVESGMVPEDKAASDCVIMYTKSAKHDQLFERFKTRVVQNPDILFVIVADECHNGCTHGGAHNKYVNDENLHHQSNFVLLGVRYEVWRAQGHCCCPRDCCWFDVGMVDYRCCLLLANCTKPNLSKTFTNELVQR